LKQLLTAESKEAPGNDLDALEGEVAPAAEQESSMTIPPEQIHDEGIEPGPVSPAEQLPKNPISGADTNTIKSLIRMARTATAAISDPTERRKAQDVAAREIRAMVAPAKMNTYGQIAGIVQANNTAQDAKPKDEPSKLGKDIYEKYNPHSETNRKRREGAM
jgi:hypothetical protein